MNDSYKKEIESFVQYSYAKAPTKPIKDSIVRGGAYLAVMIMSILAGGVVLMIDSGMTGKNHVFIFACLFVIIFTVSVILKIRGERKENRQESENSFIVSQIWLMFALWLIIEIIATCCLSMKSRGVLSFVIATGSIACISSLCSFIVLRRRISNHKYSTGDSHREKIYANPQKYGYGLVLFFVLFGVKNVVLSIYVIASAISVITTQHTILCLMQLYYARKYHLEDLLPKFQYY